MNQNVLVEKDRRLFKRYQLRKPCLVTSGNLVGLIKDLSCGGCSFQYVKKKGQDSAALRRLCLEPLGMAEVQVEVIDDRPSVDAGEHSLATMHLRRVKFVDLSLLQMRSLQEYIRKRVESADKENSVDEENSGEKADPKRLTILQSRMAGSKSLASAAC